MSTSPETTDVSGDLDYQLGHGRSPRHVRGPSAYALVVDLIPNLMREAARMMIPVQIANAIVDPNAYADWIYRIGARLEDEL
jgi:hypothetical protein